MSGPMTALKVLSLGWGVQSFTLAAMVALGELEPLDAAIHSDTGFESKLTYEFAKRWTPWLQEHGVKIATVHGTSGNYSELYQISPTRKFLLIPVFSITSAGDTQFGRRECTTNWKVVPLRRWLQANRNKQPVEQWIGISFDERERMRTSGVKYITNRYPLVEKRMTRADCKDWLNLHGLEVPPKSACVFCPYHSAAQWREVKKVTDDWRRATEVDELIRNGENGRLIYLTYKRVPINELRLETQEDLGQMTFFECSGSCWL